MKNAFSLLLALVMCLSLCACGGKNDSPVATGSPTQSTAPVDEGIGLAENETEAIAKETTGDLIDGLRPEFKEAMDAYEAFYDEYFEFLEEYKKNPSDMTLMLKYTEMLTQVAEMNESFEAWDEDELNDAELKYYLDVNNRIMKKLVDIAD